MIPTFDTVLDLLDCLPPHTRVVVTLVDNSDRPYKVSTRTWRWMARDIPRHNRRFTNLDLGTECWPRSIVENAGFTITEVTA